MFKKIFNQFHFLRRLRITQTGVLIYGTLLVVIGFVSILGWDAYLFMQSISPPQAAVINKSEKISLTAQEIDDAIHILDQREQQFNILLKQTTGSTTISF